MPIQVLPPQLANQIAAGEVVERPASVVKELLENSLDAGATRIEIDIERGGAKRIRIRDNGSGIAKEELVLALTRHATSKITCLDDLENIISMGFRGEALASVSAVSRLTLISRTAAQSEAWQAYVEGRELAVTLKPAAHPIGTTVDVVDLFYNMPARRKFMRSEKTEFINIDEVIYRIALARFNVTFVFQHNGKIVRQYRAVSQQSEHLQRISKLCGPVFVKWALGVSWKNGNMAIHGWITDPAGGKLEIQYSYVNRRTIRNKLINHAIRQAYQNQLAGTQQPAFILFLDLDPHQVDINVHPAKHEVRFHQARLVHDFIYQAVVKVLQQKAASCLSIGDKGTGSSRSENHQVSERNCSLLREHPATIGNRTNRAAVRPLIFAGAERRYAVSKTGGNSEHLYFSAAADAANNYYLQPDAGLDNIIDCLSTAVGGESALPHKPVLTAGHGGQVKERNDDYAGKTGGYQGKEDTLSRKFFQTAPLPQKWQKTPLDIFARPEPENNDSLTGANEPLQARAALSSFVVISEAAVSAGPAVASNTHSFGRMLTLIAPCYALVESTSSLMLLSLPLTERSLTERQLTPGTEQLRAQPLLIPLRMPLRDKEAAALKRHQVLLQEMGIALQVHLHQAILHSVPLPLRQQNLQNLIPNLLGYLHAEMSVTHYQIAVWLAHRLQYKSVVWSHSKAIQLLAEVERLCPHWVKNPPDGLLVTLNFEDAIKILNHEKF